MEDVLNFAKIGKEVGGVNALRAIFWLTMKKVVLLRQTVPIYSVMILKIIRKYLDWILLMK